MPKSVEDELVKALDEAYAMEKQVEVLLQSMIRTTADPSLTSSMETHLEETREHARRLEVCLESHGQSPSKVKSAGTMTAGALKAPLDMARHEKGMRNARDGFATEHLEIAAYRIIEELAKKADDQQALTIARQNAQDEERMAQRIASNWSKFVALDLREEQVS
jgi:ferritin-like metal-binding protein YciE